jgi:hypothetical protein
MRHRLAICVAALLLAPVADAAAAPTQVGADAFGPGSGAVAIPFPDSGGTPPAGITLASPNVLAFGDTTTWGASDPGVNTLIFRGLTLTFDAPVRAVGFLFGGNLESLVALTVGLAGLPGLSLDLAVPEDDGTDNFAFVGFADAAGIDTLVFGDEQLAGWFTGLGGLVVIPFAVPEPGALALLGAGLVGLGLARRRR